MESAKAIKWYGAKGEFKPTKIEHGIAFFGDEFLREECEGGQKLMFAPDAFNGMNELIDTAEIRGHKIGGFLTSVYGGEFYGVIQE